MYKVMKMFAKIVFTVILFLTFASGTVLPQLTVQAATKAPSVTKSNVTLYPNYKTYQITFNHLDKSATIVYKTSNSDYAKVNKKGVVTPVAAGKATITAIVKQNSKTYSLKVFVTVKNPSITLTDKVSKLGISDSFTFKAKTYGINSKVVWSVSNTNIGTIDSKGNFSPKSYGEVIVTATVGDITAQCLVTVEPKWKSASDKKIIEQCSSAVVKVIAFTRGFPSSQSVGTGFFIDSGVLVTEYELIKDADSISVYTKMDNEDDIGYSVEAILGYDVSIDMAILRVNNLTDNAVLPLAKEVPKVGDTVYSIELSAENIGERLFGTGTIAKIGADENGNGFAQMEHPEQFLFSGGGPLLNDAGEVIGINPGFYNNWISDEDYYFLVDGLKRINTDHPISPNMHYETTVEPTIGSINGLDTEYERLFIRNAILDTGVVLPKAVRSYWIRMEQDGVMAAVVQPLNSEELYDMTICLYNESGNLIATGEVDEEYQCQFILQQLTAGDYYISIIPSVDYTGYGIVYGFEWDYITK
jgi:hypothetical protein